MCTTISSSTCNPVGSEGRQAQLDGVRGFNLNKEVIFNLVNLS